MRLASAAAVAALVLAILVTPSEAPAGPADAESRRQAPSPPALSVTTVVDGLTHPWDVQPIGGGRLLVTERDSRRLVLVTADGDTRTIAFGSQRLWASGETGLMGLEIDPRFATNRRIYTCTGWRRAGGGHDVRVIAWRLDASLRTATLSRVLVSGLPSTSGRHGGCRLLVDRVGALLVGTGDAALTRAPQSLGSLGGKVLRLNRSTGRPWLENKWAKRTGPRRYVLTYGHRNVQGLAQRNDGTVWSVEHGTHRDDEVNRLVRGGNFGWRPGPGYDESAPMTDHALPGRQISARWRSGQPTVATSGASFVYGADWGAYTGTLAVACLKGERLMFMRLHATGGPKWVRAPQALRSHGRLRSVTRTGGALLVTTANGANDKVLRVEPR
jgi:glucose/arabinose dehydrogenase